jgi:hypothetical protein
VILRQGEIYLNDFQNVHNQDTLWSMRLPCPDLVAVSVVRQSMSSDTGVSESGLLKNVWNSNVIHLILWGEGLLLNVLLGTCSVSHCEPQERNK